MTGASVNDSEVNLSQIARLAGVGRACVANWRRRHDDFPEPVGGTETSPTFRLTAAERWLLDHEKILPAEPPREPAIVTFAGGTTVQLLSPVYVPATAWSTEFEELGGFIPVDAAVPWPTADIERADAPGHEPFGVLQADVDISHAASPNLRYLKLAWTERRRYSISAAATPDAPTPTEETDR